MTNSIFIVFLLIIIYINNLRNYYERPMLDYVLLEEYTRDITVLIVEDDESIRKEIHDLLVDMFFHVEVAVDGYDGLEKYTNYQNKNKRHFDLVITDIKMPKICGVDLSKMIYEINKEQPLIVLSAHNDSEYLVELLNIGISQFILKPIEINNFIKAIFDISKEIHLKSSKTHSKQNNIINLNKTTVWNKKLKKLTNDKKEIKLSKKEMLIIDCLLKTTQRTCTADELITYVWNDEQYSFPDVKNLNNIIARLRKKIPYVNIENVYGLGYKIEIH